MIDTASPTRLISNKSNIIKFVINAVFFVVLALILSYIIPIGADWESAFRPAALEFLSGKTPYSVDTYYNPPWVLIILGPFALLPQQLGSVIISLLNLLVFGLFAYRNGAGKIGTIAIILTPAVMQVSYTANIDWMVPLGLMLPPQIGLFFILAKPQIGFGVALYWMWIAWRQGGIRKVVHTFTPVFVAFCLSLLIYGLYPLRVSNAMVYGWNYSLWPYGIPIGLFLLFYSIYSQKSHLSAVASTLMVPYMNYQSYAVSLTMFLPNKLLTILFCLFHWLIFFTIVFFHGLR